MADQDVIIELPQRGSYSWPGRENLDARTRILLESRTLEELMYATGVIEAENLESVLGFWEYLQSDWKWLHDPEFRAQNPDYVSWHAASLREGGHYLRETHWRGQIPSSGGVSEYLDRLRN